MWLSKENDQDPYNRGNEAGKTVNTPSIGSGAGGGAPIGAGEGNQTNSTPSTQTPIAPTPQQKPATVQDYLGANKEQGNQLGQQFQSKLNDVNTKDTQAIDTAATGAKNQIQAGSPTYDPNLTTKAFTDASSVSSDPNQLQSFLKQWNASYTGPASFEASNNYSDASKAASDAQTHATEVADAGGRKQLLQDDYGVYGQGNKGLDQTLLQNSDNFGNVLSTGKSLGTLPDYLAKQSAAINPTVASAQSNADQTKQLTQQNFNAGVTNLGNQVATEQSQVPVAGLKNHTNSNDELLALLPPNPTDGDLRQFGLTRDQYRGLSETAGATNPDISNSLYAANPKYSADLKRYLAAQQLQKQALGS